MCVLFGSDPRCHPNKEVVLTHCWRSRRCEKPYNKLEGEGVCMCARKIGRDIVCERYSECREIDCLCSDQSDFFVSVYHPPRCL